MGCTSAKGEPPLGMEEIILFLVIDIPSFLFSFLLSFFFSFIFFLFILRTKVFSFMPLTQIESLKSLDDADNIFLVLSNCLLSDVPGLLEARCKTSYSICSPWSFALLFPAIRVSYN